jgi:hypothetical protein
LEVIASRKFSESQKICAVIYICRFASTCLCEQAFSSTKQIADKQGSPLTDCNLKNLVTLATTKLQPNIDKLAGVKQSQKLNTAGNKFIFLFF